MYVNIQYILQKYRFLQTNALVLYKWKYISTRKDAIERRPWAIPPTPNRILLVIRFKIFLPYWNQ